MFAIRARRKVATERDFLDAVEKVVRQGTKFSSTYVFFFPFISTINGSCHTDHFTKCIIRVIVLIVFTPIHPTTTTVMFVLSSGRVQRNASVLTTTTLFPTAICFTTPDLSHAVLLCIGFVGTQFTAVPPNQPRPRLPSSWQLMHNTLLAPLRWALFWPLVAL